MPKKPRSKKPRSKYDEPIRVDATPGQILKTVFAGKPKPKGEWEYLKNRT